MIYKVLIVNFCLFIIILGISELNFLNNVEINGYKIKYKYRLFLNILFQFQEYTLKNEWRKKIVYANGNKNKQWYKYRFILDKIDLKLKLLL